MRPVGAGRRAAIVQRATGRPVSVFNTDQGSQFTSEAFTQMLLDHGIEISMDGRGRCHNNIFVERLCWTVKHEWVCLRACQESCVEGRLQLNLLLCGEPFAEHDGELRLGGGPFAWRHLPLAADLAQHQEQQLGCRFVIGEVATAAHCGA